MSKKRKDIKGRILRTGESQRKDGRYVYKYIDAFGKTQYIYSWKLVSTDTVPRGKRDCISLREQIEDIQKDITDNIDVKAKKMTLCELYKKHISQTKEVKPNTIIGRQYLINILENDKLGARSIDSIKSIDAKAWAKRMQQNGYSFGTINNYKRSLLASFYTAIENDYVRKNPFNFALNSVIEDNTKKKEALTEEQKTLLLEFVKSDSVYQKYYNAMVILLKTGLRISELCGLTINDIDFENGFIDVNHQLLRDAKNGYYTAPPKTGSGERFVPIVEEVESLLQEIVKEQKRVKNPFTVDGYHDFLFFNQKDLPMTAHNYNEAFNNLTKKYNKHHTEQLPKITPHILRHTFCTDLAHKNMNPKNPQYIMGHKHIGMTLDHYAHTSFDRVKTEMLHLVA